MSAKFYWLIILPLLISSLAVFISTILITQLNLDPKQAQPKVIQANDPVIQLFNTLSPEEKIGQLLAIPVSPNSTSTANLQPGFIGLFDTEGLTSQPINLLIKSLKIERNTGIVPLVFADYEGGQVNRFRTYWGKTKSLEQQCQDLSFDQLTELGRQLGSTFVTALDLDGIWGPVVDRSNPNNPTLRTRTCSNEPLKIITKAGAYLSGLKQTSLLTIIKHYPGLGGTNVDPHQKLGQLEQIDHEVFGPLLNTASGVMVTHVKLGQDQLPCSLSSKCLATLNQFKQTHPEFLVFSDDLGMGAIENNFTDFEAGYLAIIAGVDALLYGRGFPYDRLLQLKADLVHQYEQDPYFQTRADEAVIRILKLKHSRNQLARLY